MGTIAYYPLNISPIYRSIYYAYLEPTASEHHTAGIGAAPSFLGVDADAFVHRRRAAGVEATKHQPYFLRRLAVFVEAHFFQGLDAVPVRCRGSADRRRSTG